MILVVSHDAGGAEILASWVRQEKINAKYLLTGPAVEIFRRKLGKIKIEDNATESILAADWVITGTSWSSDLEREIIAESKDVGKKVVSFVDHWVNYPERFEFRGDKILPEEIWLGDEYAVALAEKHFPKECLRIVVNPFFEDVKNDILHREIRIEGDALEVLYVCEPVSERGMQSHGDPRRWGYDEFDAISYFVDSFRSLSSKPLKKIVLRPHPAEPRGKYDRLLNDNLFGLSTGGSLVEDVCSVDWVAGLTSTALVVGLLAKKKVVSCYPPGAVSFCELPHPNIIKVHGNPEAFRGRVR